MAKMEKSSVYYKLVDAVFNVLVDNGKGGISFKGNIFTKEFLEYIEESDNYNFYYDASAKKSKIKKGFVIGDMWDRIDILKDDLGCDDFIEETYKAMPTVQANEILEYIARNHDIEFDEPEYMASTKKSKMKKTPLVDINADDIALSINFYSSGMTDVENGTVKFDAQGDFLDGSRYGGEGITTFVERFSYPISDFVNPDVIREVKGMVADAMIDQINDQWRIKDGNIEFRNDFANINGYSASAKKSKSFNEMIKEQRKQYKNKKVL